MIELNGRAFRRNGETGWRMVAEETGCSDITFGPASVWEWQMLAAALDEIERLSTPENVECRTCDGSGWKLLRPDTFMRDLCPDCNGEGTIPTPENVECRRCGGRGFLRKMDANKPCPDCTSENVEGPK